MLTVGKKESKGSSKDEGEETLPQTEEILPQVEEIFPQFQVQESLPQEVKQTQQERSLHSPIMLQQGL